MVTLERADAEAAEALYALLSTAVRRTPRDLSLTALSMLSTLARTGARRITELAATEGVSQPAMTSMVTKLAAEGHVVRRRDPADGRAALVVLTDSGATYLADRRRDGWTSLQTLVSKLPAEDASRLASVVPVLRTLLDLDTQERDPAVRTAPTAASR